MEINVVVYPSAAVNGTIEVPDDIEKEDIKVYAWEHFDQIDLDESALDIDWCDSIIEVV